MMKKRSTLKALKDEVRWRKNRNENGGLDVNLQAMSGVENKRYDPSRDLLLDALRKNPDQSIVNHTLISLIEIQWARINDLQDEIRGIRQNEIHRFNFIEEILAEVSDLISPQVELNETIKSDAPDA